ncbi:MAG: hypothetical protein KAT85_02805, partial [candidate division Zixibacteria bacterium]|nr:hypothetical protein [candidate division Zixibacteria bacterium]
RSGLAAAQPGRGSLERSGLVLSQYRHTSAILDRERVSDQIAEKYCSYATGPDPELTAGSKNETLQMVIARIPDSEKPRSCNTPNDDSGELPSDDTSDVSNISLAKAITFCQKQRLLWRIKAQDIELSDKGALAPIFETFDISSHTLGTDENRSGVTNGSQITTFFRNFEAFKRIIMNIRVDKL